MNFLKSARYSLSPSEMTSFNLPKMFPPVKLPVIRSISVKTCKIMVVITIICNIPVFVNSLFTIILLL
jgi:hypothetical protein